MVVRLRRIKGYYPFLILSFGLWRTISPALQSSKTHFSNIPSFQHSDWGAAPNLCQSMAVSSLCVKTQIALSNPHTLSLKAYMKLQVQEQ